MTENMDHSGEFSTGVIRGLDPRIHPLRKNFLKRMDGRVKPGHDDAESGLGSRLQYRGDAVDLDVEMSRPRGKVDQDPRRRIFGIIARMDRAPYRFIAAEVSTRIEVLQDIRGRSIAPG